MELESRGSGSLDQRTVTVCSGLDLVNITYNNFVAADEKSATVWHLFHCWHFVVTIIIIISGVTVSRQPELCFFFFNVTVMQSTLDSLSASVQFFNFFDLVLLELLLPDWFDNVPVHPSLSLVGATGSTIVRGTVVERWSVTGELSLFCARLAADGWPLMWVNCLSAVT